MKPIVFAEFFNETARAIHTADPDARVLTSDYLAAINRVGHGAWMPLFTAVDGVAYKSYWSDQTSCRRSATGCRRADPRSSMTAPGCSIPWGRR